MVLDVADCFAQPIRILARSPQDVKRQTLRAFGTNPGETPQLLDETNKRIRIGQISGQWSVVSGR
jgi:hypothetical protein